jgi:hypothetical protein
MRKIANTAILINEFAPMKYLPIQPAHHPP